jgi:hypothetical protein
MQIKYGINSELWCLLEVFANHQSELASSRSSSSLACLAQPHIFNFISSFYILYIYIYIYIFIYIVSLFIYLYTHSGQASRTGRGCNAVGPRTRLLAEGKRAGSERKTGTSPRWTPRSRLGRRWTRKYLQKFGFFVIARRDAGAVSAIASRVRQTCPCFR